MKFKSVKKKSVSSSFIMVCFLSIGALLTGCERENNNKFQLTPDLTVAEIVKPSVKIGDGKSDMVVRQGVDSSGQKVAMTSVSTKSNDIGEKVPHYGSLTGGVGGLGAATSTAGDGEDYTDKCDVYWKLNWIRKELLAGRAPYNLADVIKKSRQELNQTRPDGNLDLAAESLDHLEIGLVHLAADQDIQAAHISRSAVPWSSGPAGIRRFIETSIPGAGSSGSGSSSRHSSAGFIDDDDMAAPSSSSLHRTVDWQHQRAISVMEEYSSVNHASPESLMRKEFRIAIQKMNRLRDNLHLEHRKENSDGDSTEVGAGISERVNIGSSRAGIRSTGSKGIVVQGVDSGSGPSDPFESNIPPSKRTP